MVITSSKFMDGMKGFRQYNNNNVYNELDTPFNEASDHTLRLQLNFNRNFKKLDNNR